MAEANKWDKDKTRYDLMPKDGIDEICKVLAFGAEKYGVDNWKKGMGWSRPFRAAIGHLWAWFWGETKDPESGLSHLAHAGCNIFFLIYYQNNYKGSDDRPHDHIKDYPF